SSSVRRTEVPDQFRVEVERRPFPAVRMGTSADLMIGETVVAIGNPHGQEHTVSDGIVSGLHRDVQAQDLRFSNLIQTDASINLGNSGGPLLNIHGELIGINTVMNTAAENIGFAIPVDRVREVLEEELIPNASRRAWIGIDLDPMEPGLVTAVVPGSPAEGAGLCVGHRIVRLGERRVESTEDWTLASLQLTPGELTPTEVEGPDGSIELKLIPWSKVDGVLWRHLGLRVQVLRTRRSGDLVRVVSVRERGPAAATGLQEGDLLPAVRPSDMTDRPSAKARSGRDLAAIVERMAAGDELEVEVIRVNPDLQGKLDRYVGSIVVSGE
ncbi:MAG: trypsin-like peptidase domain-containing protein, partial [Planctomycetota bacterium]|nr:trypsin-like peptidase domain-containing protein [Planctomycetota bacterium]